MAAIDRSGSVARMALLVALVTFASVGLFGCAGTPPQPTATVTVTAQPSVSTPSASPPPTATTTEEAFVTVDPEKYRRGIEEGMPGYGFNSPSGKLWCGIVTDLGDGTLKNPSVGCLTEQEIAGVDCDALTPSHEPGFALAPQIEFFRGSKARVNCSHEGGTYGGEVLPYDHRLTALGVSCTSRRAGVTCVDDETGRGFKASRSGFIPIG